MAGGDPYLWVHEDGGVQPNHVVALLDKVTPPGVLDVTLELDAEGALVVGGGEAAVNLGGLEHEAAAFGERYYGAEVNHGAGRAPGYGVGCVTRRYQLWG